MKTYRVETPDSVYDIVGDRLVWEVAGVALIYAGSDTDERLKAVIPLHGVDVVYEMPGEEAA